MSKRTTSVPIRLSRLGMLDLGEAGSYGGHSDGSGRSGVVLSILSGACGAVPDTGVPYFKGPWVFEYQGRVLEERSANGAGPRFAAFICG